MTIMEDNRKKKDGDDADFLAGVDDDNDEAALREKDTNPLAEEEAIQEDDSGSD